MKKQLKYVVICMISMMVLLGAANNVKAFGLKENLNVSFRSSGKDKIKQKGSYWLQGVSKSAGGNMHMYYNGNKIKLKGKTSTATSRNKLSDAPEKEKSYNLQVANDCKIFLVEFENTQTQTYKKWVKQNKYKKGDEVSCIQAVFEIKDGKIRRIFFSA